MLYEYYNLLSIHAGFFHWLPVVVVWSQMSLKTYTYTSGMSARSHPVYHVSWAGLGWSVKFVGVEWWGKGSFWIRPCGSLVFNQWCSVAELVVCPYSHHMWPGPFLFPFHYACYDSHDSRTIPCHVPYTNIVSIGFCQWKTTKTHFAKYVCC
jgi:hypothetical protein